ncbi:hypothetical protein [Bacillus toyonensis]|uniref:hypothetical protein n=1 Tax=Bacillus toyonensis TaxID=155322 RepID=UPI00159BC7FF|nr:hypothetical protein [Bacillus toyonensis]
MTTSVSPSIAISFKFSGITIEIKLDCLSLVSLITIFMRHNYHTIYWIKIQ